MRWLAMFFIPVLAAFGSVGFIGGIAAPEAAAAEARTEIRTEIIDRAEVLSDSDEEMLAAETAEVALPEAVQRVVYVTFAENKDNLNDTVLEFGQDQQPDFINESGNKWAPGLLIVAVGLGPNRMGVYCGDDVCSAVDMYGDGRLDGILDQMESPLKDGNYAVGMLEGTKAAADTSVRRSGESTSTPTNWGIVGTVLGALGAVFAGIIGLTIVGARRKKVAALREKLQFVKTHHGQVATRLDELDVRAHSLSSPLANDALRAEWLRIKNAFLDAHDAVNRYDGVEDKHILARASAIEKAHESVTQAEKAEEQIEALFQLEHGDTSARRHALTALHDDVRRATLEAQDLDSAGQLGEDLELLGTRILALRDSVDSGTGTGAFMDEYVEILREYGTLTDYLKAAMYAKTDAPETTHATPRLGESGWAPGVGHYYVPYTIINNWHSEDVSAHNAAQSSSSSSATTGYSSPGFSGGGGSRGF